MCLLCFVIRDAELSDFSLNAHAATQVLFDDGVFDLLTRHQDGFEVGVVPPTIGVIVLPWSLILRVWVFVGRICEPRIVPLFKEMNVLCIKGCISRSAVKSSGVWEATLSITSGLPPRVTLNGVFYNTSQISNSRFHIFLLL